MLPQDVITALQGRFGTGITNPVEFRGDYSVSVAREQIVDVCLFLKKDCDFAMLTDLSGVDNYGQEPRFDVHYTLYSFTHRFWFRLKVAVPEQDLIVDTVTDVWLTADWHEREAFDMFGIIFRGHPNLKRILMWEGYPYFPLRKDFPLAGLPAELPETAVGAGRAETAPMLGGPYVSSVTAQGAVQREPRQYSTLAEQTDKLSKPLRKEDV